MQKASEFFHANVVGMMQVDSIGGNHYYISFKDDHSAFKILFYMKHKNDVFQLFKRLQHISSIATSN